MKILIVDDEALARDRLSRMLDELDDCSVVGEAANGEQALQQSEQLHPDIILLDIRMPGMDGMEAARHLSRLETPPAIIFTTAYDEYALPAFETHAIDYLLKPVRRERLQQALQKARKLTSVQQQALDNLREDPPGNISARVHGGIRLIPLEDIYYFQADNKYVSVIYREGSVLIEESLKSLEDRLGDFCLRVHRNALVARQRIRALRRNSQGNYLIEMEGTTERVEVSRRHAAAVKDYLQG